jgi:hypothetical protein
VAPMARSPYRENERSSSLFEVGKRTRYREDKNSLLPSN